MKARRFALLDLLLLPLIRGLCVWVRRREAQVLRDGRELGTVQLQLARALGVRHPQRVRIQTEARVPLPLPEWARALAQRCGWLTPHVAGMTLGYGIVIREPFWCDGSYDFELLAHELAHVAQYEQLGGIGGFLRQYVRECVWPGYPHGLLEREAHAAALSCSTAQADVIPYEPAVARFAR
jgi:hypothetical protein